MRDLPSEEAARGHRKAAKAKLKTTTEKSRLKGKGKQKAPESDSKLLVFGLSNYKTHALPDYPKTIRELGTTDGYSTQNVSFLFKKDLSQALIGIQGELEHRRCKRFYPRVHKGLFASGIAREVCRERILQFTVKNHGLIAERPSRKKQKTLSRKSLSIPFSESERLPPANPDQHYQMSNDTRHPVDISRMLGDCHGDPGCNVRIITFLTTICCSLTVFVQNFIPNLKDYALCKILGLEHDANEIEFTEAQRASITFIKNRIYQHKVLRVNYTTYDMRREQDSLNPRTHANIMVLSQEDDLAAHPYWYARIIGIYHTFVHHENSPDPILIDFLFIRWYGLDLDRSSRFGWKVRRLPKVGFVPDSPDAGSPAFGFLDPARVIRGIHLIPCFSEGSTDELLEPSLARLPHEGDLDWRCYYVNM